MIGNMNLMIIKEFLQFYILISISYLYANKWRAQPFDLSTKNGETVRASSWFDPKVQNGAEV